MSQIVEAIRAVPPIYFVLGLFCLIVLGFSLSLGRFFSIKRRLSIILQWRHDFISWSNDGFSDAQSYARLTTDSPRVQEALGGWGIISSFSPPYTGIVYQNWSVVLNGLPMIRQYSHDRLLRDTQAPQYVHVIDDAALRAIGALNDDLKQARWRLVNPLSLLREGTVRVITVPVYILAEFGLLSKRTYERIVASVFVKATAFLIGTVGFFSAVVGIVTGWDHFYVEVRSFFSSYGL
jgi:hypothetical protein